MMVTDTFYENLFVNGLWVYFKQPNRFLIHSDWSLDNFFRKISAQQQSDIETEVFSKGIFQKKFHSLVYWVVEPGVSRQGCFEANHLFA